MSRPDDVNGSNDIIVRMENDELVFEKLLAIHKNLHGDNIRFQLSEESDGTKRLLDLIPAEERAGDCFRHRRIGSKLAYPVAGMASEILFGRMPCRQPQSAHFHYARRQHPDAGPFPS